MFHINIGIELLNDPLQFEFTHQGGHRGKVSPHRRVRLRLRDAPRAQEGDLCPQGQHHEARGRPLPQVRKKSLVTRFD